jgi:hypothetical protein
LWGPPFKSRYPMQKLSLPLLWNLGRAIPACD